MRETLVSLRSGVNSPNTIQADAMGVRRHFMKEGAWQGTNVSVEILVQAGFDHDTNDFPISATRRSSGRVNDKSGPWTVHRSVDRRHHRLSTTWGRHSSV